MSNIQILNSLISFLGLACIVSFLYGPWQRLVVDIIRQELFEIRDSVFDRAATGEFDFNSKEYTSFRGIINSMVLNAPTSTFWRHFSLALFRKKFLTFDMSQELPFFNNSELKTQFDRAIKWMLLLNWLRSPFLMALTLVLFIFIPVLILLLIINIKLRKIPQELLGQMKRQVGDDVAAAHLAV